MAMANISFTMLFIPDILYTAVLLSTVHKIEGNEMKYSQLELKWKSDGLNVFFLKLFL